jgi:imidazolonepropionase-like amidohydrolase
VGVLDDARHGCIVEHAHGRGMRVAAHAHGSAGITQAARCGVDSIEHASFLGRVRTVDSGADAPAPAPAPANQGLTSWPDADTLAVLESHRPWMVPTIAAAFAHSQVDRATPESTRDLANRMRVGRLLLERGLPLVTGTDGGSPGCPNLSLTLEIELFHELGMSAMQALVSATGQAAACLGLSDRGLLGAGLRADLVAVAGNPLQYLDVLRARPVTCSSPVELLTASSNRPRSDLCDG